MFFYCTPQNSESQIMETFSTPWTQLPTTTSCWGSAVPPKPAARRAPRAWLYHAWSRKGSKYPRASSESTLLSSASLKRLDIIKSHFINPPQYYLDLLSKWICCVIELLVSNKKLSLCFLSLRTMRQAQEELYGSYKVCLKTAHESHTVCEKHLPNAVVHAWAH